MQKLLRKLEGRLGRFAIPNVTIGLIIAQVIVYVLAQVEPQLINNIVLVPALVLEGEVWRLLTFMAQPPSVNPFIGPILAGPIFAFFFWYLFYLMGTTLENQWGVFRYNLFLLVGYLATVCTGFIFPGEIVSNTFLQGSVFLAFATLFPNFELALFFILPVKIKWLALLAWIGYFLTIAFGPWPAKLNVIASVANYLLFFSGEIFSRMKNHRRRMEWQAKQVAKRDEARHRCVVCGITERDNRHMDFRYCSKCEGTCCYCSDHLANHEHVVKTPA